MVLGLVTIAIPAYKRRWLSVAIESALSQDYHDIELLIVDDDSPQKLYQVVAPYLQDPRVKYHHNEHNLGRESIVHNWNHCLSLARGEFFVLLCDDDFLLPTFVSSLLRLSQQYPQCNVFHASKRHYHDETNTFEDEAPWPEYEDAETYYHSALQGSRHHSITEFLYRTSAIHSGFIPFPCGYYSDDASLIAFSRQGGVASVQEPLAVFRHSHEHITGNLAYNRQKCQAAESFLIWLKQYKEYSPYLPQVREFARQLIYADFVQSGLVYRLWFLCTVSLELFSLHDRYIMVKVMLANWRW